MEAVKKQYQLVNNELVEQPFGSIPAVEWTDPHGNTFRAYPTDLLFYNGLEKYVVKCKKEIRVNGLTTWLFVETYDIVADYTKWRVLATGQVATFEEAHEVIQIPAILDEQGNEIIPGRTEYGALKPGYVTNSKFFTISLGYNPGGQIDLGVFEWTYIVIADKEQVKLNVK